MKAVPREERRGGRVSRIPYQMASDGDRWREGEGRVMTKV